MDEAIRYVIAASKGQSYKYPEGWDKNIKRSVRKTADQVTVRGVQVVYRKKEKAEVQIIQSSDEQMRILEMWSGHFGVKKLVCHTGEDDHGLHYQWCSMLTYRTLNTICNCAARLTLSS